MRSPRTAPAVDRSIVDGPILSAVWKIAWPNLIQNVIAGIQGMIDHAMVGHYVGYNANAAVGVSWQIFLVIIVFVGSLYSGMGVLVARLAGAGDRDMMNRVVYQAFLVSSFLGLVVFAPVGYLAAPSLLDFVHVAPSVRAEALPYLRILLVFSVTMLYFFMLAGALRAAGDAKTPMWLGCGITILNIALNVILIRGFGPIPSLGTRGAAWGTVASSGLVALSAFYLLSSGRLVIHISRQMNLRPDWQVIRSIFRFGLPAGLQGIAMNVAGVLLISYIGSLVESARAQAAYAIGYVQLFSLATWAAVSLMGATAAVAGQSLGAGKPERVDKAARAATLVGLGIAIPLGLAFLLIPGKLMAMFGVHEPGVVHLGEELLAYLSLSCVLIVIALSYTGALQGTGDTRSPLLISLISQVAIPLGWCALVEHYRPLQPHDIWLGVVFGHFARCSLSYYRFQQGRWRNIPLDLKL